MTGEVVCLRYLLRPREDIDRPELQVLSVYREHGVIPKESRDDNFNKTPLDVTRYQAVRPGDLVINKMKAWQGSLGVSAYEGIVSPDYLVCAVDSRIHSPFLHYLLRSRPLIAEYGARSKGIRPAQWRLYWEDLADIQVILPAPDEQRRIADFLDLEMGQLDGLDALRNEQLALLDERINNSISNVMFPGSLRHFKPHQKWPWLPQTGPFFPLVPLKYSCTLQSGIAVHGGRDLEDADIVTRSYLRVANVQAGVVNLGELSKISVPRVMATRSTLRPGDVLMTEGGDLDKLGRGAVWRGEVDGCLHQNHIFAVRPIPSRLLSDYLALLTQSLHGRCYFESTGKRTTNLASTNSANILNFPIPLPSVEVQAKIIARLGRALDVHRNAQSALEKQRTLLEERKRALVTAAVTGQMDVTTARGFRG